jgi:bacteriorhodopsin
MSFFILSLSFHFTYLLLLTTGTITLIEALRTENPLIRHIMNLETIISLVAGYFYSIFIEEINKTTIDWKKLVLTRYQDWLISTPLMLLTLCLVLGMNTGRKSLSLREYLLILLCNYSMLLCGYYGETHKLNKPLSCLLGFVFFTILFGYIYYLFFFNNNKFRFQNYILYFYYLFVWSLYGCVFLLQEKEKNICYNILDFVAKCFIGISLWAYYIDIFCW